jgi:hypothetical protein
MAFARRVGQRADARRIKTTGEPGICFQELLDAFLIANGSGNRNIVTRSVSQQTSNEHERISQ